MNTAKQRLEGRTRKAAEALRKIEELGEGDHYFSPSEIAQVQSYLQRALDAAVDRLKRGPVRFSLSEEEPNV